MSGVNCHLCCIECEILRWQIFLHSCLSFYSPYAVFVIIWGCLWVILRRCITGNIKTSVLLVTYMAMHVALICKILDINDCFWVILPAAKSYHYCGVEMMCFNDVLWQYSGDCLKLLQLSSVCFTFENYFESVHILLQTIRCCSWLIS